MGIYRIKGKEEYLRLIRKGKCIDINTFLEVDKDNNPIVRKRPWAVHPQEQKRIFIGFEKLELITIK